MTKLPSVPAVPLSHPPSPEATGRQPAGLPSPAAAPAGRLSLGDKTRWGKVVAMGVRGEERFYLLCGPGSEITLMPAEIAENE